MAAFSKEIFLACESAVPKIPWQVLTLLKQENLASSPILYQKEWVVYCKPPFKSPTKVIEYLGRYTHRVAISNNRIMNLRDGKVTFLWRDYRDGKKKTMIVSAPKFIRRFLLHILPSGFRKIRHYGILAARNKAKRISLCRKLTHTKFKFTGIANAMDRLRKLLGADFDLCPCCGIGHLARASPTKAIA